MRLYQPGSYEPRIEVKIENGVAQIMAESRQWQQIAELIR